MFGNPFITLHLIDLEIDRQCIGNIIYLAMLAYNIHNIGLPFKGAVTNYTRIVLTTEKYSETRRDIKDSQQVDDHSNRDLAVRQNRTISCRVPYYGGTLKNFQGRGVEHENPSRLLVLFT